MTLISQKVLFVIDWFNMNKVNSFSPKPKKRNLNLFNAYIKSFHWLHGRNDVK